MRIRTLLTPAKNRSLLALEDDPADRLPGNRHLASVTDLIVIKAGGRFIFLREEEIDWIETDGNYARVYVGDTSYVQRQTLKQLEETLDPARFVRIHRSVIVNVNKIKELRPWPTGEYVVIMRSGKELTVRWFFRNVFHVCGGGPSSSNHVFGDGGFGHLDAQFK